MARWKHDCRKHVFYLLFTGILFVPGCKLEEGWPWYRNMFDSPAPRPQEVALLPPANTLPIKGGELRGIPEAEESTIEAVPTVVDTGKGKALFAKFCVVCHGESGTGRELTEDYFTPDLTEEDYLDYSESDFYDLLVEGGLSMPNYREELAIGDRRLIISHLRALQRNHER